MFARIESRSTTELRGTTVDSTDLVAVWLGLCAVVALALLARRLPDILDHIEAARAAFVPAVLAICELWLAVRLLNSRGGYLGAGFALTAQLFAFSGGPVAYRLVIGPYIMLGIPNGVAAVWCGADAHFLFVIGSANRVPQGFAINATALLALAMLLASHPERQGSRSKKARASQI